MLLDRILDFPARDVGHAMIPRMHVDAVTPDTTVGEMRGLMARAHTRYPVLDSGDEPVGVVELADILRGRPDAEVTARGIMRPAVLVPTVMPLPAAVAELHRSGQEMACAIDEYGGFAGILTLEDLAEELVGEITDEHDEEPPELIVTVEDGEWVMGGAVHLDEVQRAVGHRLPQGDYETIAGLAIAEFGDLPEEGRIITVQLPPDPAEAISEAPVIRTLEIEILGVGRHVPSEVRIRLRSRPAPEQLRSRPSRGQPARPPEIGELDAGRGGKGP